MNPPAKNPGIFRLPADLGQWLVLAGGVIHGAGAKMLQARNDELAGELAAAVDRGRLAIRHAYALGRVHGAADAPWISPSGLAERVAHMIETVPLADVDEHQDDAAAAQLWHAAAAADVGEHQGDAAAAANDVRDVDEVTENRLSSPGAAAADCSAWGADDAGGLMRADVGEHQGETL